MTKLQRSTIKEIAEEMRADCASRLGSGSLDGKIITTGQKILEENLWGKVNGLYKPLTSVSLPILYGGIKCDEGVFMGVMTNFNDSFYNGCFPESKQGLLPYPFNFDEYWENQPGRKLYSESGLNEDPEIVLRKHLSSFLELYGDFSKILGSIKNE